MRLVAARELLNWSRGPDESVGVVWRDKGEGVVGVTAPEPGM